MQIEILIPAGLSALAIITAAYFTYKGNVKVKRSEAEATPYSEVVERLVWLEGKVNEMQSVQWIDRAYIRLLMDQWPYHRPLPRPMPEWVAAAFRTPLDPSRFTEGRRPELEKKE